jgi:uncharacterized protein YecT (DUF1311 family)
MKLILSVLLIFYSLSLWANDEKVITQMDLNQIAGGFYKDHKQIMDVLYQRQLARLKRDETKKVFVESQEAWKKYVESACNYESPKHKGSMWGMQRNVCFTNHVKQRNETLVRYLNCRDQGCPY